MQEWSLSLTIFKSFSDGLKFAMFYFTQRGYVNRRRNAIKYLFPIEIKAPIIVIELQRNL